MIHPDDAGVFLVRNDLAIVQTVDMITPIADDPYDFGRITAINAMSDIWAMGGEPLTALSIVAFPITREPREIFRTMLSGAISAFSEAGVSLIGGHSINDEELKLGFAVTGTVDPTRMLRKGDAKPGDVIVLTKPIGTGLVSTALKQRKVTDEVWAEALASMTSFNRDASRVAVEVGLKCATDVTGFGLLGHLLEVVTASNVSAEVHIDEIPLLPLARKYAMEGLSPGGTQRNFDFVREKLVGFERLNDHDIAILCDPQTSGGLLLAIPPDALNQMLAGLSKRDVNGYVIGRFTEAIEGPRIHIL